MSNKLDQMLDLYVSGHTGYPTGKTHTDTLLPVVSVREGSAAKSCNTKSALERLDVQM